MHQDGFIVCLIAITQLIRTIESPIGGRDWQFNGTC